MSYKRKINFNTKGQTDIVCESLWGLPLTALTANQYWSQWQAFEKRPISHLKGGRILTELCNQSLELVEEFCL